MTTDRNPLGQVLRGSAWSVLLRGGVRGIGLISTVILARLLVPEDFALVTMAMLPIAFLTFLTDVGIGAYLIRVEQVDKATCDSAWTMRLIQGALVSLAVLGLASFVADYFRDARLLNLLQWLSLVPLLKGLESVGTSLLLREGWFGREFQYRILVRILTFFVTIALAFELRNYWAIAYGLIVGAVIEASLSFFWHPYRPRFSLAKWNTIIAFSMILMLRSCGVFGYERCDIVFLGRALSAHFVGLYQVAIDLVTHISDELAGAIGRGSYPTFTRLSRQGDPVGPLLCQSLATVMLVCMPLGLGLSVAAADFVDVILGEKWAESADLLRWLALFGSVKAANTLLSGGFLIAIHRERMAAALAWMRFAIRAPAVLVALLLWDITAVAIAVLVSECVGLAIALCFVPKAAGVRLTSLAASSWRSCLAAILMASAIAFFLTPNMAELPSAIRLLAQVGFGALVYLALLIAFTKLWRSESLSEYDILQAIAQKAARTIRRTESRAL